MALHPEKAETGYFRDTRTERGDMSRGRLLELKNCTKTTPRRGSNKRDFLLALVLFNRCQLARVMHPRVITP